MEKKLALWLLLLAAIPGNLIRAIDDFQPTQVHISIGDDNKDIVITWVTPSNTTKSVVQYGTTAININATGTPTNFTDQGADKRVMWMHRVLLRGLTPNTRYFYHCGSDLGWSDLFTFQTWKDGNDWTVRAAMYGDLGAVNAQSIPRLQDDVLHGLYDVVIHVGDFAYNMDTDNGEVGDEFMRQIEPVAAYLPYMTCPGNHEYANNFSHYKARFTMPKSQETENMFYSWNMGPVHFIAVDTEAYYYLNYGNDPLFNQWSWLIEDLQNASSPAVRAERPWIILYGHRPMYCSTDDGDDCTKVECRLRAGILGNFGMEKLLYDYGVDVAVWAHEHTYERLLPLYNYTVLNGSSPEAPYTNPKGPVHFITGSAGCQERTDGFQKKPEWSVFRSSDYGYTRLTVYNFTHLYWEQVSDDKGGEVIDSVWVVKDQHGPYAQLYPPTRLHSCHGD